MPSSIAGSIAGGVASAGMSKLLGGRSKRKTINMKAGGYNVTSGKGGATLTVDPARQALVDSIAANYKNLGLDLRSQLPGLTSAYDTNIADIETSLGGLKAGYGDITKARVNAIRDAGAASQSNLKSDISRRRVMGSSFGNDALARNEAEFGKQEADARARSYLEELDASVKLIDQRLNYQVSKINDTNALVQAAYSYERAGDQTQLDELNSQISALQGLLGNASSIAQQNAQYDAQMASMNSDISGAFGSLVSGFGANQGWWGGYDPFSGITWNSGSV